MTKDNDFCRRLKLQRDKLSLTQSELAVKCGFSSNEISHYESGSRQPGLKNIKQLCKGLGCSSIDLLGV